MAHLGFPYADVASDATAVLGKVDGTGGCITLATTKEQLLYEVTDPFGYVTPDVIADFSSVTLRSLGRDRVMVSGARAHGRPERLKVSVGYLAGFTGEGEMTYAGANAVARAELAASIIKERLAGRFEEVRVDLVGLSSLHGRAFDSTARPLVQKQLKVARVSLFDIGVGVISLVAHVNPAPEGELCHRPRRIRIRSAVAAPRGWPSPHAPPQNSPGTSSTARGCSPKREP